jgi:hypothetical protein
MKTKMKTMLALLALGTSAFVASAQNTSGQNGDDSNGPPMHRHRPPPSPVIMALDVNHDGVIDSNEIANASAELLTLDKSGDGKLTRDEFAPPPPDRSQDANGPDDGQSPPPDNRDASGQNGDDSNGPPMHRHRPPRSPVIMALDVNHDGVIDAQEIANAPAELLTLDKNGDGKLTRDEFAPLPPDRNQEPNGPDDGQSPPPDNN